jgi:hypothetical protein
MERMQIEHMRRLLWQWGNTAYFVRSKEDEIKQFQAAIDDAYETLEAQKITDMPRGGSGRISSVERAIEDAQHRIEQYGQALERIHEEISRSLALKAAIDEIVEDMKPIEQKVLALRYVDNHRWRFIGLKLYYDEDYVRKIERETVRKLSNRVEFEQ